MASFRLFGFLFGDGCAYKRIIAQERRESLSAAVIVRTQSQDAAKIVINPADVRLML